MMRKRAIRIVISGIILVLLGAILFGKKELFYFLAPTHRVDASVLVVEGWISEEALQQVLDELRPSHAHDRHAGCSAIRHRSQLARPVHVGRAAPSSSAHTHFTTSDGFVDACRYEC